MRGAAIAILVVAGALADAGRAMAQVPLPGGRRALGRAATYFEPFADLERGRWGLSVATRAGAANSSVSLLDLLALKTLSDADSLRYSDMIGAIGLVPEGDGLEIQADVASRVFVGGPVGSRLALGLSGGARVYGRGMVDSQLVGFLREGVAARPALGFGATEGRMLALAEAGAHVTLRLSGGPRYNGGFTIGAGARMVRPAYHVRAFTALDSRIAVSADSVIADIEIEALRSAAVLPAGSVIALDGFLGWESRHHAFEIAVGSGGTLRIAGNERRAGSLQWRTGSIQDVKDSVDALRADLEADPDLRFPVRDTVETAVVLPTLINARLHLFWDRWLGAELGVAQATGGPFAHPAILDAGLRLGIIPMFPITAGVELTRGSLPAYYVRTGFVVTHFQVELAAAGLGAPGNRARGAGGMVRVGLFF